ncbi:MAG: ABC transporter [Flavobacteriales bacterium TMED123]|nr:MAG: ABC transporter [Flavobacteriales bacterium TMED123]
MIQLENIHLKLGGPAGEVNILRGINLSVAEGDTVSIVGPSGSGKTTMLMVIAGLEKATSGNVRVNNIDLNTLDEDGLAVFRRETMGIVFQNFHLVSTMSALENVAIPIEFAGFDDAFEQAREGLEAVGLGHRIEHYPGQLSGGEQQRVALARAFVTNPRILLADEPTGNLDKDTSASIIDLLFSLTKKFKTTLILITHDLAIGTRCQREVHIADGQISTRPTA